jgi:Flp pilus assembly protein TadG
MRHPRTHDRAGGRRGRRRAVATVELALLLPFLCFLFVAAVDFARVFFFAVTLENCARNGAYYASNYPNSSYLYNDYYGYTSLSDAVLRDAGNLMDPNNPASNPTYTVGYDTDPNGTFSGSTPSAGGYVKVTVTWTFNSLTNYPGIPASVNLARSSVMQVAPASPTFSK